jgi:1,3-beta-glucanosyltransferase GAS1
MRAIAYLDYRDDFNGSSSLIDPLEDGTRCARDIPYLQELGINTLYIPYIRLDALHSSCMRRLRSAGIYVLVNLMNAIEDDVGTDVWSYSQQRRWTGVMGSLASYSNVLGFWFTVDDVEVLPFAKAAIRDLKEYLRASGNRAIPIGFNKVDYGDFALSEFLSCGGQDISADFLFFALRRSCPNKDQRQELRDSLRQLASFQSNLPLFIFSRVCNTTEVAESKILLSAYNGNYTTVHSGAMLFRYFDSARFNDSGRYKSLTRPVYTLTSMFRPRRGQR